MNLQFPALGLFGAVASVCIRISLVVNEKYRLVLVAVVTTKFLKPQPPRSNKEHNLL